MDSVTQEKVAIAGQFLIQAAATLRTLTDAQLKTLQTETAAAGGLLDELLAALLCAAEISAEVAESLASHTPNGFEACVGLKRVESDWEGYTRYNHDELEVHLYVGTAGATPRYSLASNDCTETEGWSSASDSILDIMADLCSLQRSAAPKGA